VIHADDSNTYSKAGSGYDADGSIGPYRIFAGGPRDEQRRKEAPRSGPYEKIDGHHPTDHCTSEDGMGKSVADIGHPSEHYIDTHQAAQPANQCGGYDGPHKETVLERLQQG
jgi:hypothetical protein